MEIVHGSLFNGFGAAQLAARWLGWKNLFSCEWDGFCNEITNYHFPECLQHGDIDTTDFTIYRGIIDVLSGGFPCQPFSQVGKRKGKDDPRYKWPQMLRAVREIQPGWVVAENVYGIVNWNRGLVFEQVQADLEAEGYEVFTFVLPAAGIGADHIRKRVWFIAYSSSKRLQRSEQHELFKKEWEKKSYRSASKLYKIKDRYEWTAEPIICSGTDGVPTRLDGITFSKWRQKSVEGYGNAIVPQLIYQIFKVIDIIENA